MATHPEFSTVLVTGANSFLAGGIIDKLLSIYPGTKIHAAVRRESSVNDLKHRYGDSITVFVTPDISVRGAYLAAAANTNAIFHTASPFTLFEIKDAKKDMLDPAINGALSAMHAAAQTPSVKRVVFTSSCAAMQNPLADPKQLAGTVYTEADWCSLTYEDAAGRTDYAPVYITSKTLAEKAAWDFMRNEPRHFDLVVINPVQTAGAYNGTATGPESISMSNKYTAMLMDGDMKELPPPALPATVNLDEVSQAHVKGLVTPQAAGKRYLVSNGILDYQRVADLMQREFSGEAWIGNVPKGTPGKYTDPKTTYSFDATRGKEELGIVYTNWEQGLIDFCRKYGEDRKNWVS